MSTAALYRTDSGLTFVNRRRLATFLVWLMLALLASGVEVGGSLQPSRLVAIVALVWTFGRGSKIKDASPPTKLFFCTAAIWLVWGLASVLWTPDPAAGVHQLIGLLLGFATVLSLANLAQWSPDAMKAIRLGWVWAFMFTLPIAAWELALGGHLPAVAVEDYRYASGLTVPFASATLGNRNTYVTFITFCLPFILWSFGSARSLASRLFYIAVAALACALVSIDSSRLGLITILLEIIAFVWFSRTGNVKRKSSIFLLIAAILFAGVMAIRASAYSQLRLAMALTAEDESIEARRALYSDGLLLLQRSWGVGVGAGGFETSIMRGWDLLDTHTAEVFVVNAHNLWVEVLADYGVAVGGLFIGWIIYCFRLLWRANQRASITLGEEGREAVRAVLVLLVGLPTACLINSSFLTFTIFWSGVAAIAAIAAIAWHALNKLAAAQPRPAGWRE